jgi:hypothetical protein
MSTPSFLTATGSSLTGSRYQSCARSDRAHRDNPAGRRRRARSRLRARLPGFARRHGSPHSASFAPSCPLGTVIPPSTNILCPASQIKAALWKYLCSYPATRSPSINAKAGVPKFNAAVAAGSPTGFWRMSGHPAVQQALPNHYFDSLGPPDCMSPPKLNPSEPPWYVTRMPGGVGGVALRGVPLGPDLRPIAAVRFHR